MKKILLLLITSTFLNAIQPLMPVIKHLEQQRDTLLASNPDKDQLMQLADIYLQLGDMQKAYLTYQQRTQHNNASEQDYYAWYQCGHCLQWLKGSHDETVRQQLITYYLKAYELRPHRAEPLYKLAHIFFAAGNESLGFLFLYKATRLPYPANDTLGVQKELYDYKVQEELGIHAWYAQQFDIGQQALESVEGSHPNPEHIANNLRFYKNRLPHHDARVPKGFGIDFCAGMSGREWFKKEQALKNPLFVQAQQNYDNYIVHGREYAATPRIPKIIHQIWLGGPLPESDRLLQRTWIERNPGWEYKLWTEKEIEALGLRNKALYDAANNWGEKADIARYEILYRFGGLYVDTDFECIQSFDVLHHCSDFYAGLETEDMICNALIGCAPGHPIIKQCVETVGTVKTDLTGWQAVVVKTGPVFLSNCIQAHLTTSGRIVIFPANYFYPWRPPYGTIRKMEHIIDSIRPETFAIHHWHSSWA